MREEHDSENALYGQIMETQTRKLEEKYLISNTKAKEIIIAYMCFTSYSTTPQEKAAALKLLNEANAVYEGILNITALLSKKAIDTVKW